ncbi:short-chain dehydrogenase/reductase family protein-like protein [Phyllosticta citrichinensis]|uniref:Short-chain dehydrogenase/reductase family protein-like protein n=1 Tax=Phyllosticta citrichinensis TaxID=1130410 RepID=A0ABR1Y0N9_9PEZI
MSGSLLKLFRDKWNPPTNPRTSFNGATILITRSNTGLGLEAAIKFAKLGASHIILGVRSPTKGSAAATTIAKRSRRAKDPSLTISVWPLDMLSHASVYAFAERAAGLERLDAAVLNAGVYKATHSVSAQGWEETLQVNVVSTVLLALLLLPTLARSKRPGDRAPVLEIVSSGMHKVALLRDGVWECDRPLEACNGPKEYHFQLQYNISKLFVMAGSTKAVADGPDGDVVVTSCCPGLCKSDLGRDFSGFLMVRIVRGLFFALFARSTEQGARSLVSGLTLGKEANGQFWQHDKFQEVSPYLVGEKGEAFKQRVWTEILESLRKDVPEVLEITRPKVA